MIARIRRAMAEKDNGFTLIELLVVMIIIGILAAIAIPVFLNQRKSAIDASIKSDVRTVATLAETIYVNTQAYPATATLTEATTSFPAAAGQPVAISNDNTIIFTNAGTSFCITGTNPNGNATDAASAITYNSATGGLGHAC